MSDNQARQELRDWVRARHYRDRAAEFLELACNAPDPDVQDRYVTIAQHYGLLAQAEERSADQKGSERRSRRGASIAAGPLLPKNDSVLAITSVP